MRFINNKQKLQQHRSKWLAEQRAIQEEAVKASYVQLKRQVDGPKTQGRSRYRQTGVIGVMTGRLRRSVQLKKLAVGRWRLEIGTSYFGYLLDKIGFDRFFTNVYKVYERVIRRDGNTLR